MFPLGNPGNLLNLPEIFWLSLCVCCYYDSQFLYFKMYQDKQYILLYVEGHVCNCASDGARHHMLLHLS